MPNRPTTQQPIIAISPLIIPPRNLRIHFPINRLINRLIRSLGNASVTNRIVHS